MPYLYRQWCIEQELKKNRQAEKVNVPKADEKAKQQTKNQRSSKKQGE